jgi:hypothetical protein
MGKIILDLCGGTGSWSKPYADRGYQVHIITLPKYDIFDTELTDGIICFRDSEGKTLKIPASEVYGVLAAPTCTMFSLARSTAKTPRDLEGGMRLVKKCLDIIWYCKTAPGSTLKFWALENPLGLLRWFLGRPLFTFSPDEFGENYTKKTDIWGYFNTPKKKPYKLNADEQLRSCRNNRVLPELPEGYIVPEGWRRQAARRSMTSPKFAEAFFRANK